MADKQDALRLAVAAASDPSVEALVVIAVRDGSSAVSMSAFPSGARVLYGLAVAGKMVVEQGAPPVAPAPSDD